jgi:hypothetical protein
MQIDSNMSITLKINVEMTNVILAALSTQPYERVAGIISNIQQQAAVQLAPPPAETTAGAAND